MRPIGIPANILENNLPNHKLEQDLPSIRAGIARMAKGDPEVSVVIPAYNEEDNILKTLASLSKSTSSRSVEIIVVNNNSSDRTGAIVEATGAICVLETVKGIASARNAGLRRASGKYVLNADADTIYPPDWIETFAKALDNSDFGMVYGSFSFIPTAGTPRMVYFFYEYFADFMRWVNKTFREEAMNVYGFNSGFRRAYGLEVDGFNHPPEAVEDGWLALKIKKKGLGKLHLVANSNALAWTTDRRIQIDGGLGKGILKRCMRMIFRDSKYR